jgi:photosystem II stability/assembly factor-like uncharacterized protein
MKNPLAIAVAVALSLLAPRARALGVDDVVAKHVEARGGAAKLHAVATLRTLGTVRVGDGDFSLDIPVATATKRGRGARVESTIQGLVGVDAIETTNARAAWSTEPWEGRRDPFRRSEDESHEMVEQADVEGPLVDWRTKGHKVEYLGTEDVDGTPAHKLRVALAWGDVEYVFLDPDSWMIIREEMHRFIRGDERVSERDYGAYESFAGVWFATAIDVGSKGRPKHTHVTVERIEVNVDVDDALFHFPAAGTKVGKAIVAGPATAPTGPAVAPPRGQERKVVDSGVISGLGARNVGSAQMSGRIAAVAAYDDHGVTVLYVGAASGGVWKSRDGGTTFKPVFDEMPVQSIGAIAVDPSNPKTVWVGTGESWTRNSVSIGDGIYKSTDEGETWTKMGLPDSERITRIVVSPKDGNVVYACVPGKLWSDSADRGLYKTTDGGKHWAQILKGANLSTGCSSVAMDPKNPDVLFAGTWDFRRKGWTFRSGGDGPDAPSGSALYQTKDGGKSWTKLSTATNKGIPAAPWGRVEVEVAPSDPKVVYALIESKGSALYRSADGGATWEERDKSQMMVWRPFYFARLVIDPTNADRVFKPDLQLIVSDDGGRSFTGTNGGSHGDWHDLWIDPKNPKHIVGGDDGGLWTSVDGGSRWWKSNNLPVAQFYHVAVDERDPYQIYGGLQDNSSWVGDSAYPGGISNHRWENLYGGDGFWTVPDPSDPNFVYAEAQGGDIGRVDRRSLVTRNIKPRAGYKEKLRFNWNTPIHASPTQAGTIYVGAQFLFRSRDRGDTWERVSPDLTTNDPQKQKQEQSGGVTVDNSYAEMHTTIYSIAESPKDPNVVWVGTDDGNLQISRDACKTWTNTVANATWLPKGSWVSWVEPSRYDAGTAYAAFDRHSTGDMEPWVYKTTDYGKSWTRVVGPWHGVRGYAHVIKEDPQKPSLLYLGTELGLWITVDGGTHWAEFKGGRFPAVAVRDIAVQAREGDLVVATHGRGIWVIDDLTPLRAMTPQTLASDAVFLPGRPTQQRMQAGGGWADGDAVFIGENPPAGALVSFYQRTRHVFGPLKLEVLDANGHVIDTFSPPKRRGINRVTWSMQVKPPRVPRAAQVAFGSSQGPRVLPGKYTLRLTKGASKIESTITVGLDHRAPWSEADRRAHLDESMKAHALFGRMSDVVDRIDATRASAEARLEKLGEKDATAIPLRALVHGLDEAKKKIVATKEGGAITGEERIRENLDHVYSALVGWEGRPAKYQVEGVAALARELDDVAAEVDRLAKDAHALDDDLRRRGMDPIATEVDRDHGRGEEPLSGAASLAAARCAATRGEDCDELERAARANTTVRFEERD